MKIFYMGKQIQPNQYTKWQVLKWRVREFFKLCLRVTAWTGLTIGILYATFMAGAYFNPIISYAVQDKIVEVERTAPVMERIAKCESGNRHFENGQVLVRGNKTRESVDVGKYQINTKIWGKKATELGFDIFSEKGNTDMAMYIFKNFGSDAWNASKKCWN